MLNRPCQISLGTSRQVDQRFVYLVACRGPASRVECFNGTMHVRLKCFGAARHDLAVSHLPTDALVNEEFIQQILELYALALRIFCSRVFEAPIYFLNEI